MSALNVSRGYGASGGQASPNVGASLRQKEREKSKEKDSHTFKKEESILDKLGTLGRGKQKKQPQETEEDETIKVEYEGREAIDSSGRPITLSVNAEDLEEGEERAIVTEEGKVDPKVKDIIKLLIDWINDVLAPERIVVKDILEDLYDGLVIQKLLETLANIKMEVPEVSQSEEGQRQKLRVVLQYCQKVLAQSNTTRYQTQRWNAEAIQRKDLAAILQLLVALALHFRAPIRFPEHCQLQLLLVQKREGQLYTRYVNEEITSVQDEYGVKGERDAFDTLYDFAPDKLSIVRVSLMTFINKHLNKINLDTTDMETQFQDGVFLVLLMGLLEGYFVPLYSFHLTPSSFEQKVHNVSFAFELMQEAGMAKPKCRSEDIVNGDVKCTLRVLHALFTKYKYQ